MTPAVFANIFEFEAGRQIEVDLHRTELPEAAEGVDELDVDFGAVERGFAGNGGELDALAVERVLKSADGECPVFIGACVVGTVVRIPGRQLDLELVKAESFVDGFSEVDAGYDFIFNLGGSAENVRVVLREAADAQQAVHGAGALVAIDVAEFGVALR